MAARALLAICLLAFCAAPGASGSSAPAPAAPVIGLLAAADPAVTTSLAAGARLALQARRRETGVDLTLIVAERSPAWSAASGPAVQMAFDDRVIALVTPPDRATAHLLAQLGSRAHLPVVSTSEAPSVTGTGSFWVVSVAGAGPTAAVSDAFRTAYRATVGREPDAWAALGYDAASAIADAVHHAGLDRRGVVDAWRSGLAIRGAAGEFGFDEAGRPRRGDGSGWRAREDSNPQTSDP